MKYIILEKARTPGAKDIKKRKHRVSSASDVAEWAKRAEKLYSQKDSGKQEVDEGYKKWGMKYIDHVLETTKGKNDFKRGMRQRALEIRGGKK